MKSYQDVPQLDFPRLFPRASGLFVVGLTENAAAADLEWNISFVTGFDRQHEGSPIDIASATFDATATQGVRSAEYTTATNFLPSGRLVAWWRNKAGISGVKTGLLSAYLGIRIYRT